MSDTSKVPAEAANQKDCSPEQVYRANEVLPNAAEAFGDSIPSIEEAIKTADIVPDTNALLLPYGAGANSLKEIVTIFTKLKDDGRLFLPAQVAREFVKNRPNKLSDLQQSLSDKMGKYIAIEKISFPILEGLEEYKQLNEALEKSTKLKSELAKINSHLLKRIRSWEWNDPVNTAYRQVFTADRIVEPTFNKEETLAELLRRQRLSIPPGYKDSNKADCGIGDFLIWKTIISIGSTNKKSIIFVSADEKADWQHRSGGSGFLPRYELIDEYRRASSGKAFYMIALSGFLELLKVGKASVEEIKKEEVRIQEATAVTVECPSCHAKVDSRLADHLGASAKPTCSECGERFHIHRTRDGLTIHRERERVITEMEAAEIAVERVACPKCTGEAEGALGKYRNATAWCRCDKCKYSFPIHRRDDGSVMISARSRGDLEFFAQQ